MNKTDSFLEDACLLAEDVANRFGPQNRHTALLYLTSALMFTLEVLTEDEQQFLRIKNTLKEMMDDYPYGDIEHITPDKDALN